MNDISVSARREVIVFDYVFAAAVALFAPLIFWVVNYYLPSDLFFGLWIMALSGSWLIALVPSFLFAAIATSFVSDGKDDEAGASPFRSDHQQQPIFWIITIAIAGLLILIAQHGSVPWRWITVLECIALGSCAWELYQARVRI